MFTTLSTRARVRVTQTARIREWSLQGGRYSVCEVTSLYGLSRRYLVIQRVSGGGGFVLTRHRKRTAAVRALERVAQRQGS